MKLHNKFFTLFILLSVIPITLLGFYSYNTAYDAVRKGLYQSARIDLENYEKLIYQKVKAIDWMLNLLINNEELQDKIKKVDKGQTSFDIVDTMMRKLLLKVEEIKGLVFLMSDNRIYTSNIETTKMDAVRFKLLYGRLDENPNGITWFGSNALNSDLFGEISKYTIAGAEITNSSRSEVFTENIKVYFILDSEKFNGFIDLEKSNRNIIIYDQNGKQIFDNRDNYFKPWSIGTIKVAQNIFSGNFGTFDDEINNQDIVISHYKSQLTGWTIVELRKSAEFYSEIKNIAYTTIIIVLLSLILIISIYLIVAKNITKPLEKIANLMKNFDDNSLKLSVSAKSNDEIGQVYKGFNKMIKRINDMINELIDKEKEKKDAEFKALNYQINPHFLYNTMGTIRFMALSKQQDEIANAILIMTRFLRTVLNSPRGYVTISDEMILLNDYIGLLQIRYKGRLKLEMNIDPCTEKYVIPTMLVQPIVENAVMHGLNEKLHKEDGDALIRISTVLVDNNIQIHIFDNGNGMPLEDEILVKTGSERSKKVSIGLKNIKDRIALIYGTDYGVSIQSEKGCYTNITITLPCIEEELDEE